jgi:hypothetical protein
MDKIIEVSKDEFFARVGTLNVHPHNGNRDYTDWEMQDGTRRLIGRSTPGWASPYGTRKAYWLVK